MHPRHVAMHRGARHTAGVQNTAGVQRAAWTDRARCSFLAVDEERDREDLFEDFMVEEERKVLIVVLTMLIRVPIMLIVVLMMLIRVPINADSSTDNAD